jgi:hypothetical protein
VALLPIAHPARSAQIFGGIIAAGLGFFLANMPVQLSDSLGNLMRVASVSWPDLFRAEVGSGAFFRPLLLPQTKAVFQLSAGHYYLAFRGLLVLQVFACVWLFVRMLRVRTTPDLVAAVVAVAALAGSHTFAGMIREAYPINNYLTVALCCLAAVNIQMSERSRWQADLLALGSFVLALGTIETGLIVWGCLFIGYVAGWRGVSRGAMFAATSIVVAYFILRFFVLDLGLPSVVERSSGFGFSRLDPPELAAIFDGGLWRFYAYNVASSVATVLFSEPRAGVWLFVRDWQAGDVTPSIAINVAASTSATILILWFVVTRRWWRRPVEWSHGQRLALLAVAVLGANAGISYPYTKDQIMSIAGVFFAAALFAAASEFLTAPPRRVLLRTIGVSVLMMASTAWSWRVIGLQHNLVHTAFSQRNDWASLDGWAAAYPESQSDPALATLVQSLQQAALSRRVPNPHAEPSRYERFFDHHTD